MRVTSSAFPTKPLKPKKVGKLSVAQLAALASIVKHGRASYSASHRIYKRHGFSTLIPAVVENPDGVLNTRSIVALIRRGLITLVRAPGQEDGIYRPTAAAYEALSMPVPESSRTPAHAKKKSNAQLEREITAALAQEDDGGIFYLTDVREQPLGHEFTTRDRAKRVALKLVRDGSHGHVEVWHRWRGDRYMQGLASAEGWSDV